jgi:hypothetical protein
MTASMIKWYFQVRYPVPVSLGSDGFIDWEERIEQCEICLPDSIEDPATFLKKTADDDQVNIIDFISFVNPDS